MRRQVGEERGERETREVGEIVRGEDGLSVRVCPETM